MICKFCYSNILLSRPAIIDGVSSTPVVRKLRKTFDISVTAFDTSRPIVIYDFVWLKSAKLSYLAKNTQLYYPCCYVNG